MNPTRPKNEALQLSALKPGLGPAIEAYARWRKPIPLIAANGETLARFMPRERYDGDLSRAFRIKADVFRKHRSRAAHIAFLGRPLLVRQRDGEEYVFAPPESYAHEINPLEIERQTKLSLFGQATSLPDDIAALRAAIAVLDAKVGLLVQALPRGARSRAKDAKGAKSAEPNVLYLAQELGRLEAQIRQIAGEGRAKDREPD